MENSASGRLQHDIMSEQDSDWPGLSSSAAASTAWAVTRPGNPLMPTLLPSMDNTWHSPLMSQLSQSELEALAVVSPVPTSWIPAMTTAHNIPSLTHHGFGNMPSGSVVGSGPIQHFLFSQEKPWSHVHTQGVSFMGSTDHGMPINPAQGTLSDIGIVPATHGPYLPLAPAFNTGTIPPSDSGYESRPRPSTCGNSIAEDSFHGVEQSSVVAAPLLQPSDVPTSAVRSASMAKDSASTTSPIDLTCASCGKTAKTRSLLKKCMNRHTLPFLCDIAGCDRRGGFATQNDLDRHKKCRHPEGKVPGERYRCTEKGCKSSGRSWPRLDNFRDHMKRCHDRMLAAKADMREFVYRESNSQAADLIGLVDPSNLIMTESPVIPLGIREVLTETCNNDNSGYSTAHTIAALIRKIDCVGTTHDISYPSLQQADEDALAAFFFSPAEGIGETPSQMSSRQVSSTSSLDLRNIDPALLGSYQDSMNNTMTQLVTPGYTQHVDQPRMPPVLDSSLVLNSSGQYTAQESQSTSKTTTKILTEVPHNSSSSTIQDNVTEQDAQPTQQFVRSTHQQRGAHEIINRSVPSQIALVSETASTVVQQLSTLKPSTRQRLLEMVQEAMLRRNRRETPLSSHDQADTRRTVDTETTPREVTRRSFTSSLPVMCEVCNKPFPRKCELRKHMMRHNKPFRCTMPNCSVEFGSKDDWKRHENSQHFQLETWRCDISVPRDDGGYQECGKVCHRRETFRSHLLSTEHTPPGATTTPINIKAKLKSCCINTEHGGKFWCGFCETMIDTKEKGGKAFAERINHIERHLTGKGTEKRDMLDYKKADAATRNADFVLVDEAAEPDSVPRRSGTRKSKRHRETIAEDGSDQRRKRTKSQKWWMIWQCCDCGDSIDATSLHPTCEGCNHAKCSYCPVLQVHDVGLNR